MYNDYMYAIDRSDEYLEHYGIKGMKWGVRKAIERGGTGLGNRRLARQYRKAQKKLAKLEKRANNGAKYARRAAALGAGAAAAGGLAAIGTKGISSGIARVGGEVMKNSKPIGGAMRNVGHVLARTKIPGVSNAGVKMASYGRVMERNGGKVGGPVFKKFAGASKVVNDWGNSNAIGTALQRGANSVVQATPKTSKALNTALKNSGHSGLGMQVNKLGKISNNTIARAGAAALGAGLAGAAGYNAYRAATTKRAAQKAADFRKEMNKTFAGTAYGKQGGSKKRRRR